MTLNDKYQNLLSALSRCESLAVAYSGGVDSAFLLKASQAALGDRVLALTVDSVFVPRAELRDAIEFCRLYGIRQRLVPADVLSFPGVAGNPPDRCYRCKRNIFEQMIAAAAEEGISFVAEGSNLDDIGDYRPGMRAIAELGIISPLRDAGLNKAEIRELARDMGLACWNKPSSACLASRIAYHERIGADKLYAIEQAEELLKSLDFRQCRVRVHGSMARIEVIPDDIPRLISRRSLVADRLRALGFSYVTLDLEGFRSGSMNEALKK